MADPPPAPCPPLGLWLPARPASYVPCPITAGGTAGGEGLHLPTWLVVQATSDHQLRLLFSQKGFAQTQNSESV